MSATVVDVLIPSSGSPQVQAPFVAANSGSAMIWQVFNANPDVQTVRIQFTEGQKYFETKDGALVSSLTKQVPPHKSRVLHGVVPLSPGADYSVSKVRQDKYTVEGLNGDGKAIAILDPIVVVKEP